MLKKKKVEEEDEEIEEDEEDLEEEMEEQTNPLKDDIVQIKKAVGVSSNIPQKTKAKAITQRYVAFNQPQRMGIADSETGEVIAEGEQAIHQALAKIMSQQEDILNNLGSMIEG